MAKAFYLQRSEDVNNTSGTGRIWEGVLFSNDWVAGKWLSDFPSYGLYPNLRHVREIHGHGGKTQIVFEDIVTQGYLIAIEALNTSDTTDGNPWVAEGMEFKDGWIVLLQLAKFTSVYWYRNIDDLKKVTGKRSRIHRESKQTSYLHFPQTSTIWQREKIFVTTKTGLPNN